MGVRTIDELQDSIDAALAWRRIELAALKGLTESHDTASATSPAARGLRRAGVAMLYAHWEGFAKESLQSYVEFVSRRRLKLSELNDGLLRTSLMHTFRRADTGDSSANVDLLDLVRRSGEVRAQFPKHQVVDTRANLRAEVLLEILNNSGLETVRFELKEHLIDRRLCDARNSVAHGREMFPAVGEFAALHVEVVEMMESLRDVILAAARLKLYRVA
jgi:hypothetical protein